MGSVAFDCDMRELLLKLLLEESAEIFGKLTFRSVCEYEKQF